MNDTAELGVHAYSEYVDIPPGGSVTLTFDLVGVTTPGTGYTLSLHNQPMVLSDHDTVRVEPAAGWTVTGPATWLPGNDVTDRHTFVLRGDNSGTIRALFAQVAGHLGRLARLRVTVLPWNSSQEGA